jgi:hypothetical protein
VQLLPHHAKALRFRQFDLQALLRAGVRESYLKGLCAQAATQHELPPQK